MLLPNRDHIPDGLIHNLYEDFCDFFRMVCSSENINRGRYYLVCPKESSFEMCKFFSWLEIAPDDNENEAPVTAETEMQENEQQNIGNPEAFDETYDLNNDDDENESVDGSTYSDNKESDPSDPEYTEENDDQHDITQFVAGAREQPADSFERLENAFNAIEHSDCCGNLIFIPT